MTEVIRSNIEEESDSIEKELSDIRKELLLYKEKVDFIMEFNLHDNDYLKWKEKKDREPVSLVEENIRQKTHDIIEKAKEDTIDLKDEIKDSSTN